MKRRKSRKDLKPAPGDLAVVQALLNTVDAKTGRDELKSPRALADWLVSHELLAAGVELDAADRERVHRLRQGWRSLLAGSGDEDEILEALDEATAAAAFRARNAAGGAIRFESKVGGLAGALARLLLIAKQAQAAGTWELLKVCPSPECRTVFYDRSTNHSGKWCSTRCGNRIASREAKRRDRLERRQYEAGRRRFRARPGR